MHLYRVFQDEKCGFLTLKNDRDIRYLRKKLSIAQPVGNECIEVELIMGRESTSQSLADFPNFYSGGILAQPAVKQSTEAKLSLCGEWIPMRLGEELLYYFNTTAKVDILDLDKCDVEMCDGYIVDIRNFKFREVDHQLPMIFKMSNHITHPPLVTQQFVDLIVSSGLTGLIFEKIE